MNRLNVRCCCQPDKILGTLELPSLQPVQKFPVMTKFPGDAIEYHVVELKPIFNPSTGREEIAVYSDDRPVEFWRQFKGFNEYG